jgi:hypothetical protein
MRPLGASAAKFDEGRNEEMVIARTTEVKEDRIIFMISTYLFASRAASLWERRALFKHVAVINHVAISPIE